MMKFEKSITSKTLTGINIFCMAVSAIISAFIIILGAINGAGIICLFVSGMVLFLGYISTLGLRVIVEILDGINRINVYLHNLSIKQGIDSRSEPVAISKDVVVSNDSKID